MSENPSRGWFDGWPWYATVTHGFGYGIIVAQTIALGARLAGVGSGPESDFATVLILLTGVALVAAGRTWGRQHD